MLDVHILSMPKTLPAWGKQCVDSVLAAAALCPLRVRVRVIDGIVGHIGAARAKGYAAGNEPYVTYVDDDDYVLPHAFSALVSPLDALPAAVFSAELQWQNGALRPGPQRHHLCVYQREHLIDHTQWTVCGDLAQMKAVEDKRCIDVPEPAYVHRLYQSGGRVLRRQHHDELRMARG